MKHGKPETIAEKRAEIMCLGATLLDANYLDELIEHYQGDPEEQDFVNYCRFLKKMKYRCEFFEANLHLRNQYQQAREDKELDTNVPGRTRSPENKNTNSGELINNESEAA